MTFDRILLDIETQRDFFLPGGSLYSREADKVARQIRRLFGWAQSSQIPVISTVLRVRRGEIGPLGSVEHCLEGTAGEGKLPRTIMPRRVNLGLRNSTDLPGDIFQHHQQAIFEKRDTDIFAHARLERLITELTQATFVICGAGLSNGIVQAAVGLRSRGLGVILASDAVLRLPNEPLADMALLRMEAKGVVFAATDEIVAAPRPRKGYVPSFRIGQASKK